MKSLTALLPIALIACTHAPQAANPTISKDTATMPASTAETHQVPTLADYPDLTPEEMGRRFLKLIDSLKTIDDLTQPYLEQAMKIALLPSPEGKGGGSACIYRNQAGITEFLITTLPVLHRIKMPRTR